MSAKVIVSGSYVQDQIMLLSSLPKAGETRIGLDLQSCCGGKGFNQAVACAKQEIETAFLCAVGNDAMAHTMRVFAKSVGLEVAVQEVEGVSTGIAQVQVEKDTGKNQIGVFLGANLHLATDHIKNQTQKIADAEIFVTQLETNLKATALGLEIARDKGVTTVLNPAPINDEIDLALLKYVDILIPNESEFVFLLNKVKGANRTIDVETLLPEELHALCLELNVPTVIVTLGEKGAFVSHNFKAHSLSSNAKGLAKTKYSLPHGESYYRIDAIQVQAVDTTGAGDAYCGGFAAGMIWHAGLVKSAVQTATAVAALSVTKPGTAPAMPSREEVLELLKRTN